MKNLFISNLIIFNNFSKTRILSTVPTRSSQNPLLKLKKKGFRWLQQPPAMTTLGCAMHTTDVAKGCRWHEHLTLAKTTTTVRRRRRGRIYDFAPTTYYRVF